MTLEYKTWIRDPVHGAIRLTALEREIIDTPAFQRLRRVKQLGLANLAFPSADYPRFEHSLGVLQVTGRLLETLQSSSVAISDTEMQSYRLAALLHDVGHYPLSHAMEDAISEHHSDQLIVSGDPAPESAVPAKPLKHEKVGELILRSDPHLSVCLEQAGFRPSAISKIFNREDPESRFMNMVSSDLDADRLDYLARTACHTGLPYGCTDIDYIVEHVRLDNKGQVCFQDKALRSVEHMLLARYFDYQTLVRHRVVAGLEMLLKDVIKALLCRGMCEWTREQVAEMITSGRWVLFDDLFLMNMLRELQGKIEGEALLEAELHCILNRVAPKTVAETEWFESIKAKSIVLAPRKLVEPQLAKWANRFEIPLDHWKIWEPRTPMKFTKAGRYISAEGPEDGEDDAGQQMEQSARILRANDGGSDPLVALDRSLMSVLAAHQLRTLRVVVVPPVSDPPISKETQRAINDAVRTDCPEVNWN